MTVIAYNPPTEDAASEKRLADLLDIVREIQGLLIKVGIELANNHGVRLDWDAQILTDPEKRTVRLNDETVLYPKFRVRKNILP